MNQQMLLVTLAALLLSALFTPPGFGNSLSFAGLDGRIQAQSLFQNIYERASIFFEKDVSEQVKDLFKETFEPSVKEIKTSVDAFKEGLEKKASQTDMDKLKENLEAAIDKVKTHAEELDVKAQRLHDQSEKDAMKGKSLIVSIEEGLNKFKNELIAKKFTLKHATPERGKAKEIEIDLKAVSNITGAYALTGANTNIMREFDTEPGVSKDPTAPLFITSLISTGTTDAATIYWVERVLLEGGAAQVAEAAKFPQISAKYSKFSADAKKTAVYAKITEEMAEDVDYIISEIQDEIISGPNSIRVLLENQVLTGDGTGQNHKGIFTYATAFAKPTGFATLANPTQYDAAMAAILQVTKANFQPDYMLVNPSDFVNMQLVKDANGNYVMPPFVAANGMVISGVRIASNNRIAEGAFLVGDMKRAKLFLKRALTLKFFDQNEDDALNDLRTITGSTRTLFRIKGPDTKAFVKGTFTAAIAAIKTP